MSFINTIIIYVLQVNANEHFKIYFITSRSIFVARKHLYFIPRLTTNVGHSKYYNLLHESVDIFKMVRID